MKTIIKNDIQDTIENLKKLIEKLEKAKDEKEVIECYQALNFFGENAKKLIQEYQEKI